MKLKLYHKTFIITFITTILTLTVFTLILQSFTGVFLDNLADDQFNNAIKQIKQIKTLDEFTINHINEIEDQNQTTIRLYNVNNELIYPRLNFTGVPILESAQSIEQGTNTNQIRIGTEMLNIEGNIVIAMLSYNANMRVQEIQQIFLNMIPLLIVIGLFISLLISYLYSKSTVLRINKMNVTMNDMSTLTYASNYQSEKGDELKDLENQIHFLYDQLINEMEKIKNFERDRQVFMRGTIHELKTPIMIMEMQLREIIETIDLSAEEEHQILTLQQRLLGMKELVNGGLDISKLESITDLQEVDISEITQEVLEYYDSMLEDKNIVLHHSYQKQTLLMHEKHLSTILSNLISNAIRYSPNDSEISITQTNSYFEIENEFEGAIDNLDSLSKPFIRGVDDQDGHGLGLYIVSNTLQKYQYEYEYHVVDHQFIFRFNLDG